MAQNEHKRQQKLAKKNKRSADIKKRLNQSKSISSREFLLKSARASWVGCYARGADGMTNIMAIRRIRTGFVACVFLVDSYCLGVKDTTLIRDFNLEAFRGADTQKEWQPLSPAKAMKWVRDAIDYARGIGFEPHSQTALCQLIFAGVDIEECTEEFVFGRDGKPFYMNGPHDTRERQAEIVRTLNKLGEGSYNFVLGGPDGHLNSILSRQDFLGIEGANHEWDVDEEVSEDLEEEESWSRDDQALNLLPNPHERPHDSVKRSESATIRENE